MKSQSSHQRPDFDILRAKYRKAKIRKASDHVDMAEMCITLTRGRAIMVSLR